jgi:hypothetical protein
VVAVDWHAASSMAAIRSKLNRDQNFLFMINLLLFLNSVFLIFTGSAGTARALHNEIATDG